MAAHDASAGFRPLWPTIVLERIVPGHEPANRALLALIRRLEAENPDLTTDYRDSDFLTLDDPAARWLLQCVNVTARDYFAHLALGYDVHWTVHGWPNVNRFGDYHDAHNHPRAYLSGTYYVQIPGQPAARRGRKDVRPGCITLYDPRGAVNMNAIAGDPYVDPEHTVTPQPGMILLWPAFVNHFVHPNLAEDPRVSVSFNVMVELSAQNRPGQ